MQGVVLGVSDFVAVVNQTLEYAYGSVTVVGELSNFRVSKGKWVYFDLKDEQASVKFFGTVYALPGPLEDGMMMEVTGNPRLHPQFGFSVTVQTLRPVGEGSIKKAASLLEAKLAAEGLFDVARKRPIPYPPTNIGLITSAESAAYSDFLKVLNARWGGLMIELVDVQVQGELAPAQIIGAIERFNAQAQPPEVLVITRGGGSAEDLQAFSDESVTRAVAGSRIPTLVAIGHERDVSLAELAADQRASTPSNAAELLVPDRTVRLRDITTLQQTFQQQIAGTILAKQNILQECREALHQSMDHVLQHATEKLRVQTRLLALLDPAAPLRRGYALIRVKDRNIRSVRDVTPDDIVNIMIADGEITASVQYTKQDAGK